MCMQYQSEACASDLGDDSHVTCSANDPPKYIYDKNLIFSAVNYQVYFIFLKTHFRDNYVSICCH